MLIGDLVANVNIESGSVEFKRMIEEGRSQDSGKLKEIGWLKTIAAFANTTGGDLYIGVDNKTHEIVSLDHNTADKIALMIRRLIKQKLEPAISYEITPIPVKTDKEIRYVLKVSVSPNTILPVMVHEDGLIGVYIRDFSSSVLASSEQIRDLILLSDNTPFDQSFTDEYYRDQDFRKLHSVYREKRGKELSEKALIAAGFMNSDGKLSRGAILFRDNYSGLKTKIVCTEWPSINKGISVVKASQELTGNILETIEKATEFVLNHSTNGFKKEDFTRTAFFSYPARSVTEAIVNAVAHRNYYFDGSQIEVNIFNDRLEVTSPGSLMGVSSLIREKNISSIIPRRRNEVICNILVYCNYMEAKGSGFDKIEEDYRGKGDAFLPFVTTTGNSFTLTLADLTYPTGIVTEDSTPPVFTEKTIEIKNALKILSFCYMRKRSAKEIAAYLDVKASTYLRKEILEPLVKDGYLIEDISTRSAMYQANHNKVFVI